MVRKVFDVIPPQESKEPVPSTPFLKKIDFVEKEDKAVKKSKGKPVWWIVLVVVLILLIWGAAYFLVEPKAEIEIWLVKTPLTLNTQVLGTLGQNGTSTIPAELIRQEHSLSQEFPATGTKSKEVKAQGTIRVYNAYSTSPQIFVATTRFVSDDGKLFRTPKRVTIPGGHYEGGKLIPGEIDILVEAGEAGEEYNIGPSTFSIPGLAGTARYTTFYAKSFEPMTGGLKSDVIKVTQEDLDAAEETLRTKALAESKEVIENSLSLEEYIVMAEAIEGEIIEVNPLVQVGQEVDTFTLQIEAEARALVLKKEDVEVFVKDCLADKIPAGKILDENSLTISYTLQEVDLMTEKILLGLEASAEVYAEIDENSVKEAVGNKRPDELQMALRSFAEIERLQVRLWPFWINLVPAEFDKIDIKLRLD